MSARDEVLGRIRTALGGGHGTGLATAGPATAGPGAAGLATAGPGAEHGYRTRGDLGTAALLDLLVDRLTDYRALVRRVPPGQVAAAAGEALAQRGARRVLLPPGLILPGEPAPAGPSGWPGLPAGTEIIVDDGLPAAGLDTMDAVVTTAAVAIAETGTIILDGSAGQGRRALTLIPDYHLCVLTAGQVVALVPEALARLDPARPLTWISGPSATSDIELDRVEGVHGPRTLEVILAGPQGPA